MTLGVAACSMQPPPGPSPGPGRPSQGSAAAAPTASRAPLVYAAVGASETVGVGADDPVREAWPEVLRATALPGARLVNVGASGATVRGALRSQLRAALATDPDVVTVWLAVNDLVSEVPVWVYERRLGRLVGALRADRSREVLVANVPRLWRLPAYRACLSGSGGPSEGTGPSPVPCLLPFVPTQAAVRSAVAAYNAAIERVAVAHGARLVDLSDRRRLAALVAADGFHPSTAGHALVAAAFADALGAGTRRVARS